MQEMVRGCDDCQIIQRPASRWINENNEGHVIPPHEDLTRERRDFTEY